MNAIRKVPGGYVDWFGKPATEEQYHAQFDKEGLIAEPIESLPPVLGVADPSTISIEPIGVSLGNAKIVDLTIPYKHHLIRAGYETLRELPGSKAELAESVSGVGDKSASDISDWIENEFGVGLS